MSTKTPRKKLQTVDADTVLKSKLDKMVELQKGIKILKDRISTSKTELIAYFNKHPQLQNNKYTIDDYAVRYVNKKTTDGMSQRLIISGLTQYFKKKGVADAGKEILEVMNTIKNQRASRIVQGIDIRSTVRTSSSKKAEIEDDDQDNEEDFT
jgi:hypothetical protein